jgi:hypothetical protein
MTLDATLARARRDSAEFPYCLSNHAPMVSIALDRLGAAPARIDEWVEGYREANGLVAPPPSVAAISEHNWDAALGQRAREADYRAVFTGETRRLGLSGATRRYLPRLIPGVAGSALHPLMRLAYATLKDDAEEGGAALGYWAACYMPLPAAGAHAPDTDDPADVLAGVGSIEGVRDYEPETDLLWHNIRAVADLPGFAPVVDRLAFGPDTPRRLAGTALALFAGTQDFAALHAITGLHWIGLVARNVDDAEPLYRVFWQVIASLVPKIGFPAMPSAEALDALRARPAPEWPDIRAKAIACADEHDISLTYSAFAEQATWGDPLYRVVAARRVGLID